MDPTTVLTELRELSRRMRKSAGSDGTTCVGGDEALAFLDLFDDLDRTLSAGGLLPAEWGGRDMPFVVVPEVHRLKIHSLRDINATCSCGKWSLTGTTSDRDEDDSLRIRVLSQFHQHAVGVAAGSMVAIEAARIISRGK